MQLPLLGLQGICCLLNHIVPLLVVLEKSLATQVLRWGPTMKVTYDLMNRVIIVKPKLNLLAPPSVDLRKRPSSSGHRGGVILSRDLVIQLSTTPEKVLRVRAYLLLLSIGQ